MTVKFDNLRIPSTFTINVKISISNFDSFTIPSWNVVEDFPRFSYARFFEALVDNNVLFSSFSLKFNIIDNQAVAIRNTSSFELESIFSRLDNYCDGFSLGSAIGRSN